MARAFTVSAFQDYAGKLTDALARQDWQSGTLLAIELEKAWRDGRRVFICGNGGSAANAIHWANDFLYPIAKSGGKGMKMSALPANVSVLTCLANDIGYDNVFAAQLATEAEPGDLLIVLSGSGNSPNVVKALEQAKVSKMKSFALLGYSGGTCKDLADVILHFPIDDMQVVEDMQLIVGHMLLQALCQTQNSGTA
ncbi:MAG: D-sedoheptulose 7-phosphate isomerase [Verrucomicrobiota bacterium]|jgi:D-sedoheptulose 7-phosphate isomerase